MADRPDLPRIIPNEKPSFFNREAGGWGYLAASFGGLSLFVPGGAAVKAGVALAITGAGTVYGGLKGMARQKREMQEGRVVKQPTSWNSGIWGGLLVGGLLQMPFSALRHSNPMLALAGSAVVGVGSVVLGSSLRKGSMQRDYDRAVAQRSQEIAALKSQVQSMEQTLAPQQISYKNTVSPQEAQMLVERQSSNPRNHADNVSASRFQLTEANRG